MNYDDCVRMAAAEAAKTEHGIIVQDTAWDGYEEIPSWIMQGYGTLVREADQQLKEDGLSLIHIFRISPARSMKSSRRISVYGYTFFFPRTEYTVNSLEENFRRLLK